VGSRAAELRREFDCGFAAPLRVAAATGEDLLAIRVGGQDCAVRLRDIAGLHACKKLTRVPGAAAALLGIAGFRGAILPVYDLRIVLGRAGTEAPRWLVIAAERQVAFAFEAFHGQLRVSPEHIIPQAARAAATSFARALVRTPTCTGPVLHLPSVLAAIAT
jgi:purine-binding chemotaxis protein CheW